MAKLGTRHIFCNASSRRGHLDVFSTFLHGSSPFRITHILFSNVSEKTDHLINILLLNLVSISFNADPDAQFLLAVIFHPLLCGKPQPLLQQSSPSEGHLPPPILRLISTPLPFIHPDCQPAPLLAAKAQLIALPLLVVFHSAGHLRCF